MLHHIKANLNALRVFLARLQGPGYGSAAALLYLAPVEKMKQVVKGLTALDVQFDRIVTSPWTRALETTELLAPLCSAEPYTIDLLCQPPRAELLAAIAERNETTAVVGHEPWLGELIAWLAFGDTRHGEQLVVKKGGVVVLEGSAVPGGMQIHAIVPPSILRAVRP